MVGVWAAQFVDNGHASLLPMWTAIVHIDHGKHGNSSSHDLALIGAALSMVDAVLVGGQLQQERSRDCCLVGVVLYLLVSLLVSITGYHY